jgi:hypothetical protein
MALRCPKCGKPFSITPAVLAPADASITASPSTLPPAAPAPLGDAQQQQPKQQQSAPAVKKAVYWWGGAIAASVALAGSLSLCCCLVWAFSPQNSGVTKGAAEKPKNAPDAPEKNAVASKIETPIEAPQKKGPLADDQAALEAELPQTLTARYQGRDAKSWAMDFFDLDLNRYYDAVFALRQIGKESLRFIAKGTKHKDPQMRLRSVALLLAMPEAVKDYKGVFLPLLTELLQDKGGWEIRKNAAYCLTNCGFKEALPAMRKAHERAAEGTEKDTFRRVIELLEKGQQVKI